jgi:hypothetical protein
MSRVDTAAPDRLPWLPDEPSPAPARRQSGSVLSWTAAGAIAIVAAGAFWLGARSPNTHGPQDHGRGEASTTVRLPAPRAVEPQISIPAQPQVPPVAAPEVRPVPVREVHIVPPRPVKSHAAAVPKGSPGEEVEAQTANIAAAPPPAPFVPPKPWDPRIFQGASGRLVQIGAFGTTHQAKEGWWFMVRAYPAVAHLPAVVRTSRNSRGRTFYRFQVGTTSQAHSEILCQRMQRIGLSCAVVGLPWKAKVER